MIEIVKVVIYEKATGKILSSGATCFPEKLETAEQAVLVNAAAHITDDYVDRGEVKSKGPRPSEAHDFDYTNKQWYDPRTLSDLQAAKWAQIKSARDEAEFGGFTWNGSLFDSDAISQSRIQGAVQLASIALANNQTVVQEWTTADNSVVSLNATDLLNLGLQLCLFINKVHDYGRVLRARIAAADSSLDVQEVLWDEAEFNATLQ